jgi:hypothetical protein
LSLPLAGAQFPFDVDLGALVQVLLDDLRDLSEKHDIVPLGALLPLAGVFVLPCLARGDPDIRHGIAARHVTHLGLVSEVADENHLVDACHAVLPLRAERGRLLSDKK